jgi:hypothetical protein
MPRPDDLPNDMRDIAGRNALPLRYETFDDDLDSIMSRVLGKARPREESKKRAVVTSIAYSIGGVIAVTTFLVCVALVHSWIFGRPLSVSIGEGATGY